MTHVSNSRLRALCLIRSDIQSLLFDERTRNDTQKWKFTVDRIKANAKILIWGGSQ